MRRVTAKRLAKEAKRLGLTKGQYQALKKRYRLIPQNKPRCRFFDWLAEQHPVEAA